MIGFLNIYKPENVTSNYVVQKIKKHFHIDKIGHMGTLDPMACGILPIAIGKATRLFDYSLQKTKRYNVIFDFGYETDTLDITGNVIKNNGYIPNIDEIKNNTKNLIGKINQIPPNFSAKCVNGFRAYDLARMGIDFELKPKEIEIFEFKFLKQIDKCRFMFTILCGSGTYIRSVGRDFAKLFNTYATMSYLERCENGLFDLKNSISLNNILECENLDNIIISPINVFKNFDQINVDKEMYLKLRNGIKIDNYIIKNNSFIIYDNKIIGVSKGNKNYLKIDTYLGD